MEVTSIQDGIIIDHVPAGTALKVLEYLRIDPATTKLALIMNTTSRRYGSKDIIKIEGDVSKLNFDILGYLDPKITITVIENGHIVNKIRPKQPQRLVNVIKCTNPRCVTSIEEGCDHIFTLTPSGRYRCIYCEQEFRVKP